MQKSFLLITMLLLAIANADDCSTIKQSIESSNVLYRVKESLAAFVASDCQGKFSYLSNFALESEKYGALAIHHMENLDQESFLEWALKNHSNFSSSLWIMVARVSDDIIEDEDLYQLLLSTGNSHIDKSVRDEIRAAIAYPIRLSDAIDIQASLQTESSQYSRSRIYGMNAKFKSPRTDSLTLTLLHGNEYNSIAFVIASPLKDYRRYDLLPELYALKNRIESMEDASEKSQWNRVQKSLEKTVPYLEQKKAEKAEIGLPLDWGLPTDQSDK